MGTNLIDLIYVFHWELLLYCIAYIPIANQDAYGAIQNDQS